MIIIAEYLYLVLSTCTFLCIVDTPFGFATSNESHRGLFFVVICRRINLGSWKLCLLFI